MSTPPRIATLAQALEMIPGEGRRSALVFEDPHITFKIYAPRGTDAQTPHTRDELYIVATGFGEFVRGNERIACAVNDVLFAAAGVVHRFENFSDDFATWVIFYGPEKS